jgi:hypothetical protein
MKKRPFLWALIVGSLTIVIGASIIAMKTILGLHTISCMFVTTCGGPVPIVDGKVRLQIRHESFAFSPAIVEAVFPNDEADRARSPFHAVFLRVPLSDGPALAGVPGFLINVTESSGDPYEYIGVEITDWQGRENARPGTVYHQNTGLVVVRKYVPELEAEMLPLPQLKSLDGPVMNEFVLIRSTEQVEAVISCNQIPPPGANVPNQCRFGRPIGSA